jgi:hypothetical protein
MNSMRPRSSSTPAPIYLGRFSGHRASTDFASVTVTNVWPRSPENRLRMQLPSLLPAYHIEDAGQFRVADRRIGCKQAFFASQLRVAMRVNRP